MQRVFYALAAAALLVAATAQAQWRIGADTRLKRFAHDMEYGSAEALGYAAVDQWQKDPPEWGAGWNGYGKRAASNLGEFVIQESVTEGLAALMHRPLDYARCKCKSTLTRVGWAVRGAFADRTRDGSYKIAVPRIAGAYAGAFAQTSWRPDNGNRTETALVKGTTSLAVGVLINLYHEFK